MSKLKIPPPDAPELPAIDWTTPKLVTEAKEANLLISSREAEIVPAYIRLGMALQFMDVKKDYGDGITSRSQWGKKNNCCDSRMTRAVKLATYQMRHPKVDLAALGLNCTF